MKRILLVTVVGLWGCIEAPPGEVNPDNNSNNHSNVTPDNLVSPDSGTENQNNSNIVNPPDVGVGDIPGDTNMPDVGVIDASPDSFEVQFIAPNFKADLDNVPIYISFADERFAGLNEPSVQSTIPTFLLDFDRPTGRMEFWVRWPQISTTSTDLRLQFSEGQTRNPATFQRFSHVWSMEQQNSMIPATRGGIPMTILSGSTDETFIGSAFKGHAQANGLTLGTATTILFWYRFDSVATQTSQVFGLDIAGSGSGAFLLRDPEGRLYLSSGRAGLFPAGDNVPSLVANVWHHIAVRLTNASAEIFVDGDPYTARPLTLATSGDLTIGDPGESAHFDELWISGNAIPNAYIELIYANQVQVVSPELSWFVEASTDP